MCIGKHVNTQAWGATDRFSCHPVRPSKVATPAHMLEQHRDGKSLKHMSTLPRINHFSSRNRTWERDFPQQKHKNHALKFLGFHPFQHFPNSPTSAPYACARSPSIAHLRPKIAQHSFHMAFTCLQGHQLDMPST